jgi:hypothetical protein
LIRTPLKDKQALLRRDDIAPLQSLVSEDTLACNNFRILRDGDVVLRMQAALPCDVPRPPSRVFDPLSPFVSRRLRLAGADVVADARLRLLLGNTCQRRRKGTKEECRGKQQAILRRMQDEAPSTGQTTCTLDVVFQEVVHLV